MTKYNIYYLDVDYTLPASGANPEVRVDRPNVARRVESLIPEDDLAGREWWWGDKFKNCRFASARAGSREDLLMMGGNTYV